MAVVVDTSVLIDYLTYVPSSSFEQAMSDGSLVIPPLVVAEAVTGASTLEQRRAMGELLQDAPTHPTPLQHWIDVGNLRRLLASKGLNVTLPDAHVAQCALDLNAELLSRDTVFAHIAKHVALRIRD